MSRPWTDRLWAKVDKRSDDECWPWLASLSAGYGQLKVVPGGQPIRAHRLVCELFHGPPGDLHALHSCDNRQCCNPWHLSWGTRSDNMQHARDRHYVGGKQRLTAEQADTIKASTKKVSELVAEFGISRWQVTNIRSGRQWTTQQQ